MRSIALALTAAAALLIAASAAATPSNPGRTVFNVTRNGAPFGTHTISVSGAGETLRAQSDVALRANVGPLTVYRFEQSCSETWQAGALANLNCSTLKEGQRTRVRAERRDNRLRVTGATGENWFPVGAFPTSWWTRPPSNTTNLINTETGAPMRVRVTNMGRELFEAGGQSVQAERIRVAGTVTADLWYDLNGRWIGCAFTARGQRIEYRLASPLAAAPA